MCSKAYQMDKCLPEVLHLRSLIMFLTGKLPAVLQHMQHMLMYNLEHVLWW